MRALIIIVFLFTAFCSFAQANKIKIKKQEAMYKVTLTGVDSGFASLKQIIEEKKLIVSNEKDPVKIYYYEAFIDYNDQTDGIGVMMVGGDATLSDALIKELEKNAQKLAIRKILAYNSFNETIRLNDVVLSLVE